MSRNIKAPLAILALGLIAIAGILEGGEAERRRIEAANHTPPPAAVYEAWTAPDETREDGTAEAALCVAAKASDLPEAPPFLGDFRLTVYTPHCDGGIWQYQTATGVASEHLATCAVDPGVIPLGTVLDIGGALTVTAVDTGSAVTGRTIDIFFDGTAEEARAWLAAFGDTAPVWVQIAAGGCEEEGKAWP